MQTPLEVNETGREVFSCTVVVCVRAPGAAVVRACVFLCCYFLGDYYRGKLRSVSQGERNWLQYNKFKNDLLRRM